MDATSGNHAIARLEELSYWYAGGDQAALDGVNLRIDSPFTLIRGASGSGKSTLLRVFNGLVPHFHGGAVRGGAVVAGHNVLSTPTRVLAEHVGFLFQDPELQTVYSVVERDVAFGLENAGVTRPVMVERVDEALHRTGLAQLRARRVATLSGGERQRLALAGLLALRPRLLALDEPLSQLDSDGAESLMTALDDVAAAGTHVVLAEHRVEHVLRRADRLVTIARGAVADGAPNRVPAAPPREHAPTSTVAAWQLHNVSTGPARDAVLTGVDIRGGEGEIVVLTGPNGGGKTTLLRTIAGLLMPLSGRVERAPGRVAYLPQNPMALLHRPTVRAEVELTLRRSGDAETAGSVLARFGLSHVADRYPRDLSTGERQRAAIAAVLAGTPGIALLDEPTRGMDAAARDQLQRAIIRLADTGCSVVLATHDQDLASMVADRVISVRDGVVRERARHELVSA